MPLPRRRPVPLRRLALTVLIWLVGLTALTGLTGVTGAGGAVRAGAVATVAPTGPAFQSIVPESRRDVMAWANRPPTVQPPQSEKPNILVVMADDMRVDDLAYAPTLRSLAEQGVSWANSFSPYPLCCPARASFFSGLLPHNHGVLGTEKPWGYQAFDDSVSIATSLSAVGYRTGFVGKYLNGYGHDLSRVSGIPSWRYVPRGWSDWVGSLESPRVPGIRGGLYDYYNTPYNVNGRIDQRYRGDYQTLVIAKFAKALINKYAAQARPWFIDVNFVAPHQGGPREVDDPKPFLRSDGITQLFLTPARPVWVSGKFDEQITKPPGIALPGAPEEDVRGNKPGPVAEWPALTPTEVAGVTEITRQRAEAIFVMDQEVARLVRHLKRVGEWDNTVVIVTSDNGYLLGEHRHRQGKVWGYEPSLRVPLLMAGPGLGTGVRYDPVTIVDLPATIVDLAGGQPPRTPDGHSVLDNARTGDGGWTTPVPYEAVIPSVAGTQPGFPDARSVIGVRTARYVYFRYANGENELYDLQADPVEFVNRAADPDYSRIRDLLDAVWVESKTCAGRTCRSLLPPALRASPTQERDLFQTYTAGLRAVYGG